MIDQTIENGKYPDADSYVLVMSKQTPYKCGSLTVNISNPSSYCRTFRLIRFSSKPADYVLAKRLCRRYSQYNNHTKKSRVGDRVLGIEIKEPVFDIDYPDDVPRVEEGLRRLEEGQPLGDEDDTQDRRPV